MNAKQYVKYKRIICTKCDKCIANDVCYTHGSDSPEFIDFVEQYAKDHPIKTVRDKIYEIFGKKIDYSVIHNTDDFTAWLDSEYVENDDLIPKDEVLQLIADLFCIDSDRKIVTHSDLDKFYNKVRDMTSTYSTSNTT